VAAAAPKARSDAALSQMEKALLGLRELILQGELPAGGRVVELNLVERLGVSRTPVRSALVKLQEEGLLEALPNGGYVVKSFTRDEILDAIEVRGTLEGLAARLAAERGVTSVELRDLEDCLAEIDDVLAADHVTTDRFARYVTLNDRFHRLLMELPRSDMLARQLERAKSMPFASPNAFVMVQATEPGARDVLLVAQSQHRGVVEAIGNREGARAESLMREHARVAHRNLQAVLANQDILHLVPGGRMFRSRPKK
jgi:GntR family transcriptional regulator of vanillate catabolism